MVDVGAVQNSSNSGSGVNTVVRDSNSQRARDQVENAQSRQNFDGIRVTAKYSDPARDTGLRTVQGEERRAIETADTGALIAMQSRRAAAESLMSLQEVGQDGLEQQNTSEIANSGVGSVQGADASEGSKQNSSTGTAEINTGGKQPVLDASGNNNRSNSNAEITLPDGKTTTGNSGAPPRGSVLDIIA